MKNQKNILAKRINFFVISRMETNADHVQLVKIERTYELIIHFLILSKNFDNLS